MLERIRKETEQFYNNVSPLEEYKEIKQASSTSRWTLRLNYSRIMTQHIFVFTFVCFLIVLNTSLVSIISLPIFLYLFAKANDREFVKNDMPKIITMCLVILVIDLLIQLTAQTPFYNFVFDTDKTKGSKSGLAYERLMNWVQTIGWRIIWNRETNPSSTLNLGAFLDYICKCGVTSILLL